MTQMWISGIAFFLGFLESELLDRSHTRDFIKAQLGALLHVGPSRFGKALEASNARPSGQIPLQIGLSAHWDDFILEVQIVSPAI